MSTSSWLAAPLALILSSAALASETPIDFFHKYESMSKQLDVGVADLYDDGADIQAYRNTKGQVQRELHLDGAQWKQLVRKAMPMAKAQDDRSTFSEVQVSSEGAGFRINATRYSTRKCYYDPAYYMVIEPTKAGSFKIVKEHFVTQSSSGC